MPHQNPSRWSLMLDAQLCLHRWWSGSMALTLPITSHLGHLYSALLVSQIYTNHLFTQLSVEYGNIYRVRNGNIRDLHSTEDFSHLYPIISAIKRIIIVRIHIIIILSLWLSAKTHIYRVSVLDIACSFVHYKGQRKCSIKSCKIIHRCQNCQTVLRSSVNHGSSPRSLLTGYYIFTFLV